MNKYIIFCFTFFIFCACTEEIDFDYNTTESQYMIEGSVTQNGVSVKITKTVDVDDSLYSKGIAVKNVCLSDNNGLSENLVYDSISGLYVSELATCGIARNTYTLKVETDEGEIFSAQSTMPDTIPITDISFEYNDMGMDKMLICNIYTPVNNGQTYYLKAKLYYNDCYAHQVIDQIHTGGNFISCIVQMENKTFESDDNERVTIGDTVKVSLMNMDQTMYRYCCSSENELSTLSNAISNFSGNCIGIFAAYGITYYNFISEIGDEPTDQK